MRTPALIFFAGLGLSGMIWHSSYGESLWMIGIGIVGFGVSLFIPKDFP